MYGCLCASAALPPSPGVRGSVREQQCAGGSLLAGRLWCLPCYARLAVAAASCNDASRGALQRAYEEQCATCQQLTCAMETQIVTCSSLPLLTASASQPAGRLPAAACAAASQLPRCRCRPGYAPAAAPVPAHPAVANMASSPPCCLACARPAGSLGEVRTCTKCHGPMQVAVRQQHVTSCSVSIKQVPGSTAHLSSSSRACPSPRRGHSRKCSRTASTASPQWRARSCTRPCTNRRLLPPSSYTSSCGARSCTDGGDGAGFGKSHVAQADASLLVRQVGTRDAGSQRLPARLDHAAARHPSLTRTNT